MKVFNLTDVPTPQLTQRGLINQTLVVGRVAVPPGGEAEFNDEPHLVAQVQGYVDIGAMSRDKVPEGYAVAKARPQPAVEEVLPKPLEGPPPAGDTEVAPQPLESGKKRRG